jgi:hypothetical protein
VRDAYVLPFQGDVGGWDRIEAMDELRSAMLTMNEDIGTIDRLVCYSASSTNSTAVPAPTTLQEHELRMYGPCGDPSCRPRRSQEHGLAAAASKQCIQEHSLGVAAKQAEESDEVSTPDEDTIDQEAVTPSDEEMLVGM